MNTFVPIKLDKIMTEANIYKIYYDSDNIEAVVNDMLTKALINNMYTFESDFEDDERYGLSPIRDFYFLSVHPMMARVISRLGSFIPIKLYANVLSAVDREIGAYANFRVLVDSEIPRCTDHSKDWCIVWGGPINEKWEVRNFMICVLKKIEDDE